MAPYAPHSPAIKDPRSNRVILVFVKSSRQIRRSNGEINLAVIVRKEDTLCMHSVKPGFNVLINEVLVEAALSNHEIELDCSAGKVFS